MPPPPLAMTVLSLCGDLAVAAIVCAGLVLGTRAGLFRGTVAAMLAIAALVLPLALAGPVADLLVVLEVPRRFALGTAHAVLVAALVWAMLRLGRATCGRPPQLPPMADAIGGGVCGATAAVMVAGTALVAWSILPVPDRLRIDPAEMWFDAGTAALTIFARSAAGDEEARAVLLEGEPRAAGRTPGDRRASETFVDADGDGRHDDDEAYLDADDNRVFSQRVLFRDIDADGRRAVGLLERYRLGRWDRVTAIPDENAVRRGLPPAP